MALTEFDGIITTNETEKNLFEVTALKHYATDIITSNMIVGDEIEIKVYKKDVNASTMKIYRTVSIKGIQSDPVFFTPFLSTSQYKVTIRRISGTDKIFTWNRYEQ